MKKKILIVGGSSGLGAEIAKILRKEFAVTVTGTTERNVRGNKPKPPSRCKYVKLEITQIMNDCLYVLNKLAHTKWDTVIWSAGFEREDAIELHTLEDVELMMNVIVSAPVILMSYILKKHKLLRQLVLISGMSCNKTYADEPIMSPSRAALATFARCMWHDERVRSVLHVAPDRMKGTYYYTGTGRDTSTFASANKVAERIVVFMKERTKFRELYFNGEEAFINRQDYSNSILSQNSH